MKKRRGWRSFWRALRRRCVRGLLLTLMLLLAARANISFFRGAFERAIQNGAVFLVCALFYGRFDQASDALERLWARGDVIDRLLAEYAPNPTEFEGYVAGLYRRLGCRARVTRARGDGGIDIHIWRGGVHYAAEVKLYARGRRVGREAIQKLWAAQLDAGADRALFVTTSGFTAQAREFALRHDIELVDGEALEALIERSDR